VQVKWENKASLIAYILNNISATNRQNWLVYVEAAASQRGVVLSDGSASFIARLHRY